MGSASEQAELDDEMLLCARFGELDDLRAAIQAGANVNHVDGAGSSALHMACANGHVEAVQILLDARAEFKGNASGNTPLHWAVQNEHEATVALLLATCERALVLAQNSFGKSALTEAFGKGSAAMLSRLLEHQSATELDQGCAAPATEDAFPEHIKVDAVHDYALGSPPVRVRVCEAAGQVGCAASGSQTVSASAIVLARWLVEHRAMFDGMAVCELGAGCGLAGMALAASSDSVRRVLLTDCAPDALESLAHNLALNPGLAARVHSRALDWSETHSLAGCGLRALVGSELLHAHGAAAALASCAHALLPPGGLFVYAGPLASRPGGESLEEALGCGFACEVHAAPERHLTPCIALGELGEASALAEGHTRALREQTLAVRVFTKLGAEPGASRWAELPGWARAAWPYL